MTQILSLPSAAPAQPPPRRGYRRLLAKLVLFVAVADVVVIALLMGLRLRAQTWATTAPIRFTGDITNGYVQGTRALEQGYWNVYDNVVAQARREQYGLDYSPLRLAVMTLWVRSVHQHYPESQTRQWRPEFTTPLLHFNTACELAAAIAVFLLVRLWVKRDQEKDPIPAGSFWRRPWVAGLAAAVLFWFNPAILWDAHAWPQWDVWCVPFFLWAAFFASVEWWFFAGLTLAVGAMFKGQILLVAPLLVLWPLFLLKLEAVLRGVAGFALAVALITFPWLVRTPQAYHWLWLLLPGCLLVAVAPILAGVLVLAALVVLAGVLGGWWGLHGWLASHEAMIWYPLVLAPVWGVFAWATARGNRPAKRKRTLEGELIDEPRPAGWRRLGRYRLLPAALALSAAAGILLCAKWFDGSMAWYAVGFEYGTRHFLNLARPEVCNLAAILQERFRWSLSDVVYGQTTMKQLLTYVYALALVLCAAGAAWHARRRDRRFLIALVAPWVLLFALLPQMHQRYLMWAAGISALCVGVSFGFTLLHLLVSAIAWSMIAHTMLRSNPMFDRSLYNLLRGTYPGLSFAVVLLALIFLYGALTARRRWGREDNAG